MTNLSNVTLACIDCYNYGAAVNAIRKSMQECKWGRVIFLTDIPLKFDDFEVIQIQSIKSKQEYSEFIVKKLNDYFDTDYVMVIQHDGYVISGDAWDDEFLEYDYIGAPWLYIDGRNVGNGGASLRSKKLQTVLANDPKIDITHPEDEIIGRLYRDYLESNFAIKFPSEKLADKFSFELRTPVQKTFAFHGYFHEPYKETVIIKRTGAMGDVIQTEPVLEYFYNNGYKVILETLPNFEYLFLNHYFPIQFPSQVDKRLLSKAKTFNLDMAYEVKPKQLHLKSYFEFCGISDYKLRNPKLSLGFPINNETKLFSGKYCVLHLDEREQPHRNIYGIDWEIVVIKLREMGYYVINCGKGRHPKIPNAIEMNITNENFLCFVVGGADLFIGIDSGLSHIASSFNVPSILFFGSVNPEYIHADLSNKICIHNHNKKVCELPFCWHESITTKGQDCIVDKGNPPCSQFKTNQVIEAIEKFKNK